jgi:CheY-like chemotaxis protein
MASATILCVDDDINGLTGRESLLRLQGYDVLVTTSGQQGLELLRSLEVDAVVLDYYMPEMMGDVVAARMKQLKPEVPILLLSAQDDLPQAALRTSDIFLSKSAPPDQFVYAVRELVEARSRYFQDWLQNWRRRLSHAAGSRRDDAGQSLRH